MVANAAIDAHAGATEILRQRYPSAAAADTQKLARSPTRLTPISHTDKPGLEQIWLGKTARSPCSSDDPFASISPVRAPPPKFT